MQQKRPSRTGVGLCWEGHPAALRTVSQKQRLELHAGGGGTVAMYIANLNVDTVDLGVPVLSMHAPYEIVSKLDVFMAHKAFTALLTRK